MTACHWAKIYLALYLVQPKLSDWLKCESAWRAEYERSAGLSHSLKRVRQTQHPEVTEMLDLWVTKAMANNLLITGEVLRQKWKTFADLAGIPDDERLSLSEGWLSHYKTRTGLKQLKWHGEAGSITLETAEKERSRVQVLIKEGGYQLCDVFNADEGPLFYEYVSFLCFKYSLILLRYKTQTFFFLLFTSPLL